jgi:hypothetical protein
MMAEEKVSYDALKRTKVFGGENVTDWTPVPPAPASTAQANTIKLYGQLDDVLTQLTTQGADKEAAASEFHSGTGTKSLLRTGLLAELKGLNKTAGTIAETTKNPALMDKFRMPHGVSDTVLASKARAFATNAEAMEADFEGLGHAPGFADALRQQVTTFEGAKDDQTGGELNQVKGNAKISALIAQRVLILKKLQRLMINLYKGNAEMMGEWQTASHVEHLSHKSKKPASQPTPPAK